MKVKVLVFGAMREYLPDDVAANSTTLEVGESATVGSVIDALGAPRRLVTAVLVNGEQASHDRGVKEGDEVTLMPPFTGGTTI